MSVGAAKNTGEGVQILSGGFCCSGRHPSYCVVFFSFLSGFDNFRNWNPDNFLWTGPVNTPRLLPQTISSFFLLPTALMNQTCFYFFVLFFLRFATSLSSLTAAQHHQRHRSGGGEGVWSWLSNSKRAGLPLPIEYQMSNSYWTAVNEYHLLYLHHWLPVITKMLLVSQNHPACLLQHVCTIYFSCVFAPQGGEGLWLSLCMQMTVWQEAARGNTSREIKAKLPTQMQSWIESWRGLWSQAVIVWLASSPRSQIHISQTLPGPTCTGSHGSSIYTQQGDVANV